MKRIEYVTKNNQLIGYIKIKKGITAHEGFEGGMPTLSIRKNGKQVKFYRGSSLYFSQNLTDEDKDYLNNLAG